MSRVEISPDGAHAVMAFYVPIREWSAGGWVARSLYVVIGAAVLTAITWAAVWWAAADRRSTPWVLIAYLPWCLLWGPWIRAEVRNIRRGYSVEVLYCRGPMAYAARDGDYVTPLQSEARVIEEHGGICCGGHLLKYAWLTPDDEAKVRRYLTSHADADSNGLNLTAGAKAPN